MLHRGTRRADAPISRGIRRSAAPARAPRGSKSGSRIAHDGLPGRPPSGPTAQVAKTVPGSTAVYCITPETSSTASPASGHPLRLPLEKKGSGVFLSMGLVRDRPTMNRSPLAIDFVARPPHLCCDLKSLSRRCVCACERIRLLIGGRRRSGVPHRCSATSR